MLNRLGLRLSIMVAVTQVVGCSRFVWHEDPFTPDPAPTSEIIASASDTTYVLRRDSYYLLTSQRSTLWSRDVIDDVAWRYRALFGEAPPLVAIRIDTGTAVRDSTTTWRGVPFVRVALDRHPQPADAKHRKPSADEQAAEDSARVRLLTGPILAATAAESWLGARALDARRAVDSQPGGPVQASGRAAALPAWIEAGALRILGAAGAPDRAAMELRADEKGIMPLASLFAVQWRKPNASEIARAGSPGQFASVEDGGESFDGPSRFRDTRERRDIVPGVSPVFLAQSVAVLAFIHERDAALVARLADETSRGASIESVLASSTTLPHDVAGLDAAWRQWLKRNQKGRR